MTSAYLIFYRVSKTLKIPNFDNKTQQKHSHNYKNALNTDLAVWSPFGKEKSKFKGVAITSKFDI